MNFLPFVPNPEIRAIEILSEASFAGLHGKMFVIDGAEEEGANFVSAAEFEKFARVGEFANRILALAKGGVEPGFQLRKWNVADVLFVEESEWEAKLGAKLFEAHFGAFGLGEHVVGGLPDGGQVVHERA